MGLLKTLDSCSCLRLWFVRLGKPGWWRNKTWNVICVGFLEFSRIILLVMVRLQESYALRDLCSQANHEVSQPLGNAWQEVWKCEGGKYATASRLVVFFWESIAYVDYYELLPTQCYRFSSCMLMLSLSNELRILMENGPVEENMVTDFLGSFLCLWFFWIATFHVCLNMSMWVG